MNSRFTVAIIIIIINKGATLYPHLLLNTAYKKLVSKRNNSAPTRYIYQKVVSELREP